MSADILPWKPYPKWICIPCGLKHGKLVDDHLRHAFVWPDGSGLQYCGWCGQKRETLAPPEAYGRPKAPRVRL